MLNFVAKTMHVAHAAAAPDIEEAEAGVEEEEGGGGGAAITFKEKGTGLQGLLSDDPHRLRGGAGCCCLRLPEEEEGSSAL